MQTVTLPTGEAVPALGVGTWRMGEWARARKQEVAALERALDHGIGLIDTAEMYGEGGAEEVVGQAVAGRREEVFIVSKVYPHNASSRGTVEACECTLKRLGTDRVDLYLLHWRGTIPLDETVEAFERLKGEGKIRHWGASNFDAADMEELLALGAGPACAANQVLYHVAERGIEWELLPYCRARGIPVMAYTPLGAGAVLEEAAVRAIAEKHGTNPAAVALAWLLRETGVIAIPKAAQLAHVDEIAETPGVRLDGEDLAALDQAFPPPSGSGPLAVA